MDSSTENSGELDTNGGILAAQEVSESLALRAFSPLSWESRLFIRRRHPPLLRRLVQKWVRWIDGSGKIPAGSGAGGCPEAGLDCGGKRSATPLLERMNTFCQFG